MPLRKIARPVHEDDISFAPKQLGQLDLISKPVGLLADTLNNHFIDLHRSAKHDVSRYFLHVSDLISSTSSRRFCPREHALSLLEERGQSRRRQISPGMSLIHTMGHAIQDHITRDFLARSPHADTLWGNWKCLCGHTQKNYSFREEAREYICGKCAGLCEHYAEINLYWEEHRIVGHPDLIIVWNNVLHIYEIKTIDRKDVDFEKMDAPLGDHTLQGSMYYWTLKRMRQLDVETLKANPGAFSPSIPFDIDPHINYLYADRSSNLFRRVYYKEFTKRASPLSRIEPVLENARSVRTAIESKRLPPRLSICTGVQSPRAKTCNCAVSCFMRNRNAVL